MQTSKGKVRLFPLESAEPAGSHPPVMEIERTCKNSQKQESLEDLGLLQGPSPLLIKTLMSRRSDTITVHTSVSKQAVIPVCGG